MLLPFHIGPAPLLKDQHFSDLLGSQGFSASRDRPPQTLRDLKGKQDIENALDPETAKVRSIEQFVCCVLVCYLLGCCVLRCWGAVCCGAMCWDAVCCGAGVLCAGVLCAGVLCARMVCAGVLVCWGSVCWGAGVLG